MQFDLYAEITKQVMAMLEQGVVPWRSPILGRTSAGHPKNLESGKLYRGVNIFLLAFTAYARGYESSYWLTFNQARERGGSVKKGEKASMVVFWKQYETEDKDTHQPTKIPDVIAGTKTPFALITPDGFWYERSLASLLALMVTDITEWELEFRDILTGYLDHRLLLIDAHV